MSQMRHGGNVDTSPHNKPRSILVLRQNGVGHSSDDYDSASSNVRSKRYTRRSRSYSRNKPRNSDSSVTSSKTKKTTFVSDLPSLAPAPTNNLDDVQNGSFKSSSSYDASKISFQGKRAIFEASKSIPPIVRQNQSKSIESLHTIKTETVPNVENKNRKLEQEIMRLEQTAAVREEAAKRLRDKLEKLEAELGEKEAGYQTDIVRLSRDNNRKEELIQYELIRV